jgi:hypothetical protein
MFGISAGTPQSGGFGVDMPQQEQDGVNFGLTLQFQANATPLGGPDATVLNFTDGLTATRAGDTVTLSVPTTADAELVGGIVADGTTDNLADIRTQLQPGTGAFPAGLKSRARFPTVGIIVVSSIFDLDPTTSFPNDARGVNVLQPGNNLPATTANYAGLLNGSSNPYGAGADASFIRVARISPQTSGNLAYSPVYRGLNLDATGTTQTNPVSAIRIPNPNNANNPTDGDPFYTGNKDYVAGEYYNMDINGFPGSGMVIEAGNGRFHGHSIRFLNNGSLNVSGMNHGLDAGGNDMVMSGHWAVGGNNGWGIRLGEASGFYATTGNMWSAPVFRSVNSGAIFFAGRKYWALGYSEWNDWGRFDGGGNDWTGGTISDNLCHPHGVNFSADAVGINFLADGDSRLNAQFGIVEYKNVSFWGNIFTRSDGVGTQGTFTVNTSTNVLTLSKNNLANNMVVYTVPNGQLSGGVIVYGTLAAPLNPLTPYYVINYNGGAKTCQLSLTMGGSAIDITTAGTAPQAYTTFPTLGNFNGVQLDGVNGTNWQYLLDLNTGGNANQTSTFNGDAMVSFLSPLCSAPDVKSWGDLLHTVQTVSDDGKGNLMITMAAAHGLQPNHRLGFYTTGTLPTHINSNQVYYVDTPGYLSDKSKQFVLSVSPITNSTPTYIASGAGTGTLVYTNLSTRPFLQNHGNQLIYGYSDSWMCEWRWGAMGGQTPFHFSVGIAEIDDSNYAYRIEMGDRTKDANGNFNRNLMHAYWEFDAPVQYTDSAWISNSTTEAAQKNIGVERYHFFSTAGGGIADYTINLPLGNNASYDWEIEFFGGPIGTTSAGGISWGVDGSTGTPFNLNGILPPISSPGSMIMKGTYRRDTNDHRITSVAAGKTGMPMGRIDGSGVEAGVIGEKQRNFNASPGTSLTTGVAADCNGGLLLPPGQWRIDCMVGFTVASGTVTVTALQWGINTVNNSLPGTKDERYGTRQFGAAGLTQVGPIFTVERCNQIVNLSVPTTYYAVVQGDWIGGGSMTAYSSIVATRTG